MEDKQPLPEFQEALKNHSKSLTAGTYWRYVNGLLPAFGRFIVGNPDLAEALAKDARNLAAQRSANPHLSERLG